VIQLVASLAINPDEPEALAKYFSVAMPLIESAGGKVIQQIDLGEAVVGEPAGTTLMLVEYPDRESVMRVFSSKEYNDVIPYRDRAFTHYNVSLINQSTDEQEEMSEDDVTSVEKIISTGATETRSRC